MDDRFTIAKRDIKKAANKLKALVTEKSIIERIDSVCTELDQAEFRVAVIGMINDGKTTFLNGFLRRPKFMVMDVNTCTAAVSILKFGHPVKRSTGRAEITFWPMEEMQQRVETVKRRLEFGKKFAGRAVGVHTLSLPPSDVTDAEWMNEGAFSDPISDTQWLADVEAKIGSASWQEHAGQKTVIDPLGDESLDPYLAKGGDLTLLVKYAEFFLPMDPFKQPCSVLDTPGINDPDRYRSELTLNAMAGMHAYIMVISATSGVTDIHTKVLKTLRGLRRERLVVVLSKIDLLNTADDVAKVVAKTRADLRQHWNDESDTPIVVANAYFSGDETWTCNDKKSVRRKAETWLRDNASEYLGNSELQVENPEAMDDPTLRECLYQASNLPAVHAAVEEVIMRSQGDEILRCAVGNLLDFSRRAANLERERAKKTQQTLDLASEGLDRLRQQLETNKDQRKLISGHKKELERKLEEARNACGNNRDSIKLFQDKLWEIGSSWIKSTKRKVKDEWFLWASLDYDSSALTEKVSTLIDEQSSKFFRASRITLKSHQKDITEIIKFHGLYNITIEDPSFKGVPKINLGMFGDLNGTISLGPAYDPKNAVKDKFEKEAHSKFNKFFPRITNNFEISLNAAPKSLIGNWTQKISDACKELDKLVTEQTEQIKQLLHDGSPKEHESRLEELREIIRQSEAGAAAISVLSKGLETLHSKTTIPL